ncbi:MULTISPECIES: hypothetical protein [Staphylococcus]|uniref:hypothetical protein n=1 Tax=Staphylococcus sp. GDH8C109P TaxID=2804088 RepID=UPI001AEC5892|nr:hypothetical protein [Staphylococcus sp. GDH8C109P]
MNQKYEIDLHYKNGYFKIESHFGLNLNVVEEMHDTDIKSFYFDSDFVNTDFKEEQNWALNYLLLDIYNGTRIACGLKPFEPIHNRDNILNIQNHIFAYKVINNITLKNLNFSPDESNFKIALRMAMRNKTVRDLLILLNKVSHFDENTLINYYKIFDFVDSYVKLVEKYQGEILEISSIYKSDNEVIKNIKNTYDDLKKILKELKAFKRITNNYLSVGLVSRHGLLTQTPKNEDIDFVKIFNLCINSIRYIIRMNYLSSYYNFDYLVNFDLENKNNKNKPT